MTFMLHFALLASLTQHSTLDAHVPQVIEITGLDYAFQLPSKVLPGRTIIRFTNKGKQSHELNIALLKRGTTLQQYMLALHSKEGAGSLLDVPVGVLFTEPGTTGPAEMSVTLLSNRDYVVVCGSKDARDAPRHHELGMFGIMHVRRGKAPATPKVRVDSIVATEYAFRFPDTLSSGHHTLTFINNGTMRHELKIFQLKEGVTVSTFIEARQKGERVRTYADRAIGVLHSPGGVTPAGMFEVNLMPGREYALICDFADDDNSPPHVKLGMFGSIKVPAR